MYTSREQYMARHWCFQIFWRYKSPRNLLTNIELNFIPFGANFPHKYCYLKEQFLISKIPKRGGSSLLYPSRVARRPLSLNDKYKIFFEIKPAGKKTTTTLPCSCLLCASHGQGRRRVRETNRASVKYRSVVSGL